MILLDTNVLSELTRKEPHAAVTAWLDRQPALSLWTSSISIFEVRFGLQVMAAGRQRDHLVTAFDEFCADVLENRILAFDSGAAHEAADLTALRKKRGFPVDLRDTMIAGIALSRRATLATRNTRHFHDLQVPVVNPWEAGAKL
jgi:hypothetical protein